VVDADGGVAGKPVRALGYVSQQVFDELKPGADYEGWECFLVWEALVPRMTIFWIVRRASCCS
jgi:hypothetical protein